MFFDKISPLYFFCAFGIGILFCYLNKPKPNIVVKFPSPQNVNKVVYKSDDGQCYKYEVKKESCPLNKDLIKPQPLGS